MDPNRLQAVIWDFNGTLVDDVSAAVCAINAMLERRCLQRLTVEAYRSVFGFPFDGYYRAIGFDLADETMAGLADEFHDAYLPILPTCTLSCGVRDVLDLISELGVPQFVLSAMEEQSLTKAIRRLGIECYFEAVFGSRDRLANSKVARGIDLVERFALCPPDVLFIGDTKHDGEVASALGGAVALVAQGHQTVARLRESGRRVFRSFEDLRDALLRGRD